MTCIPAIVRLHGSALCCWQVTPTARGTAVAAAGRRSQLDTATGRNTMGIGFDETSITGVMRQQIAGDLIMDGDPGYDEGRRVWNGMVDRRPRAIVRASEIGDIGPAVALAREHGLRLAVRGGGHSVAGHGTVDGGMVLDLGALRAVGVDPRRRIVRVQPGATLADVDQATQAHGLAVPLGVVSGTGVAGLTVGGGVGWLTRRHGLTIDNLIAADVVTASGETVRASDSENAELFWGIRGGGGNFGVVSTFTYRAHPLGPGVFAGNLVYRQGNWPRALLAYQEWTRDLPDDLTSIVSFLVPPADWGMGDQTLMLVGFVWASPDDGEGQQVMARLERAAPPDARIIEPVQWTTWQSAVDELFPRGVRAYWKNTSFDRLDGPVMDVLLRRAREQAWRGTGFDVHHLGGAFGRVPQDATPFPHRAARFWLNIYGFWPDPADDAARTAFIRGFAADMAPLATGGLYVNFMAAEDPGTAAARPPVYGTRAGERLAALKRRYDPENVFRLNHNIAP
jgi:FAD/FMN-containing dehydrogenase